MYKLTRKKAAKKLWVSTRTIDRYVKSGKIRSKKDGKIVYLNNNDVENLTNGSESTHEIIIEDTRKKSFDNRSTTNDTSKANFSYSTEVMSEQSTDIQNQFTRQSLETIYSDLREQIKEKDTIIRELSLRLGRAEEIAKNSVPLNDFKRSQFLLEESREHLHKEIEEVTRERDAIKKQLGYEKKSNIILIIVVIVLFIVAGFIWIIGI